MIGFTPSVNPGRHRRQKAKVAHTVQHVRDAYARRRAEQQHYERKYLFECSERFRLICGVKTALGMTIHQEELFRFEHQHYISKQYSDKYMEQATRYMDPAFTLEQCDGMFAEDRFQYPWQVRSWIARRYTLVEYLEHPGPWFELSMRADIEFPAPEADNYWLDVVRVNTDHADYRQWKLRPVKKSVAPDPHAVTDEQIGAYTYSGRTALDQAYEAMINDPKTLLAMADKNQGYVHGDMWWNKLLRFLKCKDPG
jgi:hypothetical protein